MEIRNVCQDEFLRSVVKSFTESLIESFSKALIYLSLGYSVNIFRCSESKSGITISYTLILHGERAVQ